MHGFRPSVLVAACVLALTPGARLQILPAGEFAAADGRPASATKGRVQKWRLDRELAERLIADAAARQTPFVIDYDHATLRADEHGQGAPAAGWFRTLEWIEGQGLFATDVEWTAKARAMIEAGEYRYFSPVFLYDTSGAVLRILLGAITNVPALDGMAEIGLRAAARFHLEEEPPAVNEFLDKLRAALALKAESTEDDILAALNAVKTRADAAAALETQVAALKAQLPDPGQYVSVAEHKRIADQLAALRADLDQRDLDAAIGAAVDEGRLPAGEVEWARTFAGTHGIAALKESLAKRPVIAALKGTQTGGRKREDNQGAELTDEQLAVCRAMSIDPEDYKKALAA